MYNEWSTGRIRVFIDLLSGAIRLTGDILAISVLVQTNDSNDALRTSAHPGSFCPPKNMGLSMWWAKMRCPQTEKIQTGYQKSLILANYCYTLPLNGYGEKR